MSATILRFGVSGCTCVAVRCTEYRDTETRCSRSGSYRWKGNFRKRVRETNDSDVEEIETSRALNVKKSPPRIVPTVDARSRTSHGRGSNVRGKATETHRSIDRSRTPGSKNTQSAYDRAGRFFPGLDPNEVSVRNRGATLAAIPSSRTNRCTPLRLRALIMVGSVVDVHLHSVPNAGDA